MGSGALAQRGGREGRGERGSGARCPPAWWLAGSHQEVSDSGKRTISKGCDPETTQAPITIAASGWTASEVEFLGRRQRPAVEGLSSPPP